MAFSLRRPPMPLPLLLLLAALCLGAVRAQDYDSGNPNDNGNYNKYDTNPYTSTDTNDVYNRDNNPFGGGNPSNRFGDAGDPNAANRFGQSDASGGGRFKPDGSSRYGSGSSINSVDPFGGGSSSSSSSARNPFETGGRNRNVSPYSGRLGGFFTDTNNNVHNEPTYFIVASRMVRPGQLYRVAVQVLSTQQPIAVRASIARDGVEMSADSQEV